MLRGKKIVTVIIVLFMLVSIFAMLFNSAEGAAVSDEDLTPNDEIGWLAGVNINGDISFAGDEPDNDLFIGQKDNQLRPIFQENLTEDFFDVANITHSEVLEEEVMRLVGDDWTSEDNADWVDGTDSFDWTVPVIYEMTGGFTGDNYIAGPFEFHIPDEATPGIYRIPIEMMVTNYSDSANQWYGPHQNLEYVWLEISGNAVVQDRNLEPGIDFANRPITVEVVGDSDLEDVYLKLDDSDLVDDHGNQVTIHNPESTSYVSEISLAWPQNGIADFNFRFTVPFDMEPDDYDVDYSLTATRSEDDVTVIEHGTFTITVNEVVELSAEIIDNEVMQGTPKGEFTVTFTNTGNLDLERISIAPLAIDPFSLPNEYYEHSTATMDDPMIDLDEDLAVGESTEVDIILGLDQYMQIGRHRLFFEYDAYYYDHLGYLTGSEGYYEVDDDLGLVADTDEPFAWIEVTEPDVALDVGGYDLDPVSITDMGYHVVSVTMVNHGYVEYTDSNIVLHTEDTPFINPTDEEMDTINMLDERFTLHGEGDRDVHFGVIIDTEFIEERIAQNRPIYTAQFTMEALNGDTLEEVELSLTAEGLVTGIGPRLVITGDVDENTVKAGEEFELTYDIENKGDAPIRNLMVRASPHSSGSEDLDPESFDSAQDALYFWQAGSPPGSYVWDVEPVDTVLYPGENTTVTFHMVSSSDMQEGAIYHVDLEVTGTAEESWETTVTLRSEEESSAKPMLSTQLSYVLVALIIGVFFALGVLLYKWEKKPKDKKDKVIVEEEEYTYDESDEIEPESNEGDGWEDEPPSPEDDDFEEEESQIEPGEREDW